MMTELLDAYPILLPAVGGAVVGVYVSDTKTRRAVLTRAGAGIFCALTFTDALIAELGRDPAVYRTGIAGLLSMTGFEIARWFSHMNINSLTELVRAIWGKGKS